MFADYLRIVCERELGYRVAGSAATLARGIELCRWHRPDLLLLDLDLPDGNALDRMEEIRAATPGSKILAVSILTDEFTMWRLAEAELDGFVDKYKTDMEALIGTIGRVLKGVACFSPVVAEVRRKMQHDPRGCWPLTLTPRELQVIALRAGGSSEQEAAAQLGVSAETAETHWRKAMRKLGLHRGNDLIRWALEKGLARLDPRTAAGRD